MANALLCGAELLEDRVYMTIAKRITSEFIGTAFLTAAVIGSGIMAERLAGGNVALALLCNTAATVGALAALILTFGPVSGAHFNPAVSICDALDRGISAAHAALYSSAQIAGAVAGAVAANLMFELSPINLSVRVRTGPAQWLGEFIATFGLIAVIWGCSRRQSLQVTAFAVASYIGGAYWFTSSTSFANPAVTIGRSLSNTFAGIRPGDVPAFIAVQLIAAVSAMLVLRWLIPREASDDITVPHEGD